jgi:hypothetical protein
MWSDVERTQCADKVCQVLHMMWRAANMTAKYSLTKYLVNRYVEAPLVLTVGLKGTLFLGLKEPAKLRRC